MSQTYDMPKIKILNDPFKILFLILSSRSLITTTHNLCDGYVVGWEVLILSSLFSFLPPFLPFQDLNNYNRKAYIREHYYFEKVRTFSTFLLNSRIESLDKDWILKGFQK